MNIKYICILSYLFASSIFALNTIEIQDYPNVLLTNDYGILSVNDLMNVSDGMKVEPFHKEVNGYTYWKCFLTKNMSILTKRVDSEHRKSYPYIRIILSDHSINDYYLNSMYFDENISKYWRNILKNQKMACIAGSYINERKIKKRGKTYQQEKWVFMILKTKSACYSFFDGWCNARHVHD